MKKNIIFFVLFLLVGVNAYADQTLNGRQPREWELATNQKILESKDYQADTTANTNVVVTGHQATGNPGYIALVAWDGNNQQSATTSNPYTYYLWVSQNGKLVISSFPTLKSFSSFPYGDWRNGQGFPGTVVGSQS